MKQAIGYALLIVGTFAAVGSADVAPAVTPSALTGIPSPSLANTLGTAKPVVPRQATGRDYLDNMNTQAALEKLYGSATMSFAPHSPDKAERLIALDKDGNGGPMTTSTAGNVRSVDAVIPKSSQAIIHTHPSTASEVPSPEDYRTATKAGKPNFVMSGNSIYVAMPGMDPQTTQHIKVADISPAKHGKLNVKWN